MDGRVECCLPARLPIDGADIVAVDTRRRVAARFAARDTIDTTGKIVLPGLINTHGHAPMVLYRGLADDLALMDWLTQLHLSRPKQRRCRRRWCGIGTRLAALEMIQSGTTTFTDMYYFEEEIAKAAKAAGLRAVLGETIIKFPVADAKTPAGRTGAQPRRSSRPFMNDPLITPAVAPHSAYTLDTSVLLACRDLALKYHVPC